MRAFGKPAALMSRPMRLAFNLDTQSLASIVAGGIAFGYPESSNAGLRPTIVVLFWQIHAQKRLKNQTADQNRSLCTLIILFVV